jgi:hypothetical protein
MDTLSLNVVSAMVTATSKEYSPKSDSLGFTVEKTYYMAVDIYGGTAGSGPGNQTVYDGKLFFLLQTDLTDMSSGYD